ncbi:MAG: beta-ketoacyl-ACP synthase II, partial [Defluviitaleaceae bacterium]|nr:beta-ketoacyl-ACP synthase II [Defluviitaleaceae bacterium]
MKRVVITGMGVISPIGNDVPSFQKALEDCLVGIGPITKVDEPESPIKLAAEVKDFNPEAVIPKKEIKRLDLFSQYALSAADEAVKSSGLDLEAVDSHRMGVIISSGIGGMETFESEVIKFHEKGGFKIAPLFIPMMIGNMAAGNVALEYGCKGICTNVVTACAASTHAIGEAFRNIKHGYCDVILAGGTEAAVTKAAVAGFAALKALSRSSDPLRGSIPFDAERDGFVIGEGAGILVLESLEHAQARGATILGEVVGYGANCDAYHITAPSPGGEGASACMSIALAEAGIAPNEVQYINAHGTSTQLNDAAESAAIKRTFGDHTKNLLVSSSKSQFGHLLGAAGAVESIALLTGMNKGFAPATMGYKVQDEVCDLNYVPNATVKADIKYAMSNNFGFGGHNASLCFKK